MEMMNGLDLTARSEHAPKELHGHLKIFKVIMMPIHGWNAPIAVIVTETPENVNAFLNFLQELLVIEIAASMIAVVAVSVFPSEFCFKRLDFFMISLGMPTRYLVAGVIVGIAVLTARLESVYLALIPSEDSETKLVASVPGAVSAIITRDFASVMLDLLARLVTKFLLPFKN